MPAQIADLAERVPIGVLTQALHPGGERPTVLKLVGMATSDEGHAQVLFVLVDLPCGRRGMLQLGIMNDATYVREDARQYEDGEGGRPRIVEIDLGPQPADEGAPP